MSNTPSPNEVQGGKPPKQRDSNLELMRIIAMLLIVAHHYVVNSGLTLPEGPIFADPMSKRSLFLLVFGAWGKIGINCFMMITGYFMCKSNITVKKFAKLFLEVMFYRIVIYAVFRISGYEPFSFKFLADRFIPITKVEQGFTSCFIVFFLFIPFLNKLVQNLNEKQHLALIGLCSFTYIVFGTLHRVAMNYVSWFIVLYFISSYIRLYPKQWFSNTKITGILLLFSVVLSACSVIGCAWVGTKIGKNSPFFFVTDSNTFLAVAVGIFAFLFFKNIRIPYSRIINTVAASTFGVLLIHANSGTMRHWLWKDAVDCTGHYGDRFMPLYAIACVLAIFTVCTLIDILRINCLEKPFFGFWDKHCGRVAAKPNE